MKKLKIYFYSPGFSSSRPVSEFAHREKVVFVNPTPLYLDAYTKRHEPELHNLYEWAKVQYLPLSQDELVEQLKQYDIDVLALSIYTWNKSNLVRIIKNIHSKTHKPIKIIIGGPGVNVVRDSNYLADFPEVEFAIYAQGEIPFVSIVKHYLGIEKISVLKTKNVAWLENGRLKKADYEFIKIKSGSPIVEARPLLEQIVNDPELTDWILHFPYETSRGCPYNCAFCDWTSGLSHKVAKRKFAYELELETLGELGLVNLYMADANFGLFPEDVGVAETMARLKKEKKYNFWIHGNNFSKTKKDQVFKIADIFLDAGIVPYLKFSIQDIDDNVLDNIDRPDLPWSQHVEYINNLRKKYPKAVMALDIIKGLPGQTRESWENVYEEICKHDLQLDVYDWEIIANSPAGYDKEYQVKMQLKTLVTIDPTDPNRLQEDVIGTYSYDIHDYAYFTILYKIYDSYFRNYVPAYPAFIKLIKQSSKLDYYVDEVSKILADKKDIRLLVREFMKTLVIEFKDNLTSSFIKTALKPAVVETIDKLIVEIKHVDKSEVLKQVFKEIP